LLSSLKFVEKVKADMPVNWVNDVQCLERLADSEGNADGNASAVTTFNFRENNRV
jgi:hypothetical protein